MRICADLRRQLRASPLWGEQDELLQRVPGSGPLLALTLRTGAARARAALPRADRRARWGGAAEPRERNAARSPRGLGWARADTDDALHGNATRHPLQSRHPNVLRTPRSSGQSEEGGLGSLHAQAADHPQRHAQTPGALAGAGHLSLPGRSHLTSQLLCCHCGVDCMSDRERKRERDDASALTSGDSGVCRRVLSAERRRPKSESVRQVVGATLSRSLATGH
jgi:hypothetical protein